MTFMIMLATAFLLAVFGWLIRYRRMYGLISGYNMMSAKKREGIDTERLGALFGTCLFAMAGILAAGTLLLKFGQGQIGAIVLALLVPVVAYLLIAGQRLSGGTRTAGGNEQTAGRARPGSRLLAGFIAVCVVTLIAFIGFLVFRLAQPVAFAMEDGAMSTSGLYGRKIAFADMQQTALVDTLPKILQRTNGSAAGNRLSGHFTMDGIGPVMLYIIDKSQPPYIRIDTAQDKYYLNAATPDATRALFAQLQSARK